MLSHWDSRTQREVHRSINACLAPLASVDGHHVVTVEGQYSLTAQCVFLQLTSFSFGFCEGVGSTSKGLHPVQQRMVDLHGSQVLLFFSPFARGILCGSQRLASMFSAVSAHLALWLRCVSSTSNPNTRCLPPPNSEACCCA
jgi:xanthine dehydrogenase iron-sulfur cluster and FAD-binding subunit A